MCVYICAYKYVWAGGAGGRRTGSRSAQFQNRVAYYTCINVYTHTLNTHITYVHKCVYVCIHLFIRSDGAGSQRATC